MGKLTGTTNPTRLKKIDRKDVAITRFEIAGERRFQVTKLELKDYGLDGNELVVVIARSGNTGQRFSIGTVNDWSSQALSLTGVEDSNILRFRVLVRDPTSPRLVAAAEGIRCTGDGDVESLLPIISTNLGQRLWRLQISEEGPIIQVNQNIFPNGESAQGSIPFCTLVLPEALSQVLQYLGEHQELLAQDGGAWSDWSPWMSHLRISAPPQEKEHVPMWVAESTATFCDHFRSADQMAVHLTPKEES